MAFPFRIFLRSWVFLFGSFSFVAFPFLSAFRPQSGDPPVASGGFLVSFPFGRESKLTLPFPGAFLAFSHGLPFSRALRSLSRPLRSLVFVFESSSKGRRSRRPGFCRVCPCFLNKTQQRRSLFFLFPSSSFLFPSSSFPFPSSSFASFPFRVLFERLFPFAFPFPFPLPFPFPFSFPFRVIFVHHFSFSRPLRSLRVLFPSSSEGRRSRGSGFCSNVS